jgi:hypothetical protein
VEFQQVAVAYREACAKVAQAIKTSKYKAAWFIEQLGFSKSPSAYYNRLKAGNWEPDQLEKIALLLEGKSVI